MLLAPGAALPMHAIQSVPTEPSHSQNIIAAEAEEVKDAVLGPLTGV